MRLGRWRAFRYEVRCWYGGVIPDAGAAVGGPVRVTEDPDAARWVLGSVERFPTATWGRDELATGEMWNSNSVLSWVLTRSGIDTTELNPPSGGRAPGWSAGRIVALRGPVTPGR